MADDLQILARNADLTFAGEIEYERVELVPRYNAVGSWTLDVGFDGNLNTPAGLLLLPGAGIAAIANGRIIFSGPVTKPVRTRDGDTHRLTFGGADDLLYIEDRPAHQDPTRADAPDESTLYTYNLSADEREGPAESVIKGFVKFNAGPQAVGPRRVRGLSVAADGGRGLFVEESGRMQNLLELIAKLGKVGAVGFRCVQSNSGSLVFDVYLPIDKTNQVVFAIGLGNVAQYEFSSERPTANVVYVGGSGVGKDRIFRVVEDLPSIAAWGRIETFVDESSGKITKLDQAGRTELASTAARYFFSANAVDTGSHQWAPLASAQSETYDLGDIVSVIVDGQRVNEVIRELHVVHSAEGRTVTPIVGSADQGGRREQRFFQSLIAQIRSARLQVRDLQRR